jgi:mannose-1-phosphate guanylyltransferase
MSPDGISAVVLAGTHHWSGSSFERLAPRPLVPVALAPLISYPLRWLRKGGLTRVTVCANGTTRLIEAEIGDGRGLDMEIGYYKDATPRGAAGCVRDAGLLAGSHTLVVADGTAVPTMDLGALLDSHHASGAAVTAVVQRDRSASGRPTPAGIYVFDGRALAHIAETGFQDIKENLIPRLHRAGERVIAHETEGLCPHVFNAQTYLAVNQWMLQRLSRDDAAGPLVHSSARVEAGARLVGPVQLGPGARVEAGATIVGPSSLGADCVVGPGALVARSVLWSRCMVGEGSVVHGCVVGSDALVPPATALFNVVRSRRQAPAAGERRRGLRPVERFRVDAPGSAVGGSASLTTCTHP